MTRQMRYPAVPLVVHDPFFSVWSFSDRLTESWSCHWGGADSRLSGILRIDGRSRRFCGLDGGEAMEQTGCEVLPTRTIYTFAADGVELKFTFLSPLLPDDLELLSRPLCYLVPEVRSVDGREHSVQFYLDCGADWTVNGAGRQVAGGRGEAAGLKLAFAGGLNDHPLRECGDIVKIDWGRLYLAARHDSPVTLRYQKAGILRESFCRDGSIGGCDDLLDPMTTLQYAWPVCAAAHDFGRVGAEPATLLLAVAYDDVFALEFLHEKLVDYWRRDGETFGAMLSRGLAEYSEIERRAAEFDARLLADCRKLGGENYAVLCAGAYRQAVAAHKLAADRQGRPLFFSKENHSNGCVATVDVTYPSAPLFLLMAPVLLEGMLIPSFEFLDSRRWKFEFAPHDLGTYPLANGQYDCNPKTQMPVEECGNLLILTGALLKFGGRRDFVRRHYGQLRKWAVYLVGNGMDPASQLCTDDFAGHLAHNANLALKAILGLGAFARSAGALGEAEDAEYFRTVAEKFAGEWLKAADGGECTRLAFDREGTWSQKYNLVYDKLLDLNLFPESLAEREVAFYRAHQNRYGLPLDSRADYTKLDWILHCACLTGKDDDFQALLAPVIDFLKESPSRVPMTDWYDTRSAVQAGFQARSVVGGLFLRLLYDSETVAAWRRSR